MEKHYMRICKCGRIHMVDNNRIDKVLEDDKNLLLICGGCGCATVIGADIEPDFINLDNDYCYNMYSSDFSPYDNKIITTVDFKTTEQNKGIAEIIYSHGIKVPMMTGMYATDYSCGIFSDRWYPDFYKIMRDDVTLEEVMKFINDYNNDRRTVNMTRFINETPEDMIEEISHHMIKGFNWQGTKWEVNNII